MANGEVVRAVARTALLFFGIGSIMDTMRDLYAALMDTLIFRGVVKDKDGILRQPDGFSV